MDQNSSNPLAAQSAASRPVPVMDVVMPRPEPTQGNAKASVAADNPRDFSAVTLPSAPVEAAPPEAEQARPLVAPKQPSNGVTLAIIATIIIVFGLAALVTFAYLRTK